IFDQYLRTVQIPVLEYKIDGYTLSYRYTECVSGFNLPLKITFKTTQWIRPSEEWQSLNLYAEGDNTFSVDPNFYIKTKLVQ
ncbi:MAG: M1 family peptidase, partial [Ferruginibacter sp.]